MNTPFKRIIFLVLGTFTFQEEGFAAQPNDTLLHQYKELLKKFPTREHYSGSIETALGPPRLYKFDGKKLVPIKDNIWPEKTPPINFIWKLNMLTYKTDVSITVEQFIDVLQRSGLAARRPVGNSARIQIMLDNANLLVTAWNDDKLIGVSRALTDHSYCCYLSDLAVDKAYQGKGIGKQLIEITHEAGGGKTNVSLILLSAPDAFSFYERIGLAKIDNGFIIKRSS